MKDSGSDIKFEPNTKFACVALPNCRPIRLAPANPVRDRFVVLTETPFEVGADWRATLGTFRSENFARSNFLVFASRLHSDPFSKEGANDRLVWSVRAFYYALLMLGTPEHDPGLLLAGGVANDAPVVLHAQDLVRVYPRPLGDHPPVTPDLLRDGERMSAGILSIHRHESYQRVQRGFWTWVGGMREAHLHARLHQFVRAVDALIASERGKGRSQFISRGQTFASCSDAGRVLGELYDLRSVEEHFNAWEPVLNVGDRSEAERVGALRAYQAERMAGDVYSRLFANPTLRELLRDQKSIDSFWRLPPDERRTLWSTPINLDDVAREHMWRPDLLHQE